MRYLKAASMLLAALVVLATPFAKASTQRVVSPGAVHDVGAPPLPPW